MSRRKRKPATTDIEPPVSLRSNPIEQCLKNSDLLEEILRHLGTAESTMKTWTRRYLYSVALTCKSFSYSAVKLLWRRLDNLLPLLRLLPSFALDGRVYNLPGIVRESDWAIFDRHAAYVREIVYVETSCAVDSMVYVRLAVRKLPLLPNLSRFECFSDPPGAELILCISPSIASLSLKSYSSSSTPTTIFLDMFSVDSPHLSQLSVDHLPGAVLSLCKAFRTLKSIELRNLQGPITAAALAEIGSLPVLQSFTTDMVGWDEVDLEPIASRSIFCALTHLEIVATATQLHRNIPLILPVIGTTDMQSIIIGLPAPHRYRASTDWEGTQGSETFTAISQCIGARWSTTLGHLELRRIPCTQDDFAMMEGITSLHTLNLQQILSGSLSDASVLVVVRTWSELTSLSIEGGEVDIDFMQCVAQHCTALRTLHVGFFSQKLPAIPKTPALSHPLHRLAFFPSIGDSQYHGIDLHVLARHIDRMFPHVATITGSRDDVKWGEVQKLVLLCQDVRRTTLEQQLLT
ncbi:hypothetical protein B0H10DRAFT_1975198 [Mycena sp. CBHHK59/15]|nr:hypothetical protein B0H10DRAFT_1975198 [Mycena sp. CBHHK59/15]